MIKYFFRSSTMKTIFLLKKSYEAILCKYSLTSCVFNLLNNSFDLKALRQPGQKTNTLFV